MLLLQTVKSPFDVRVTPLGAHEYPNLDRVFIRLRTEATPHNIDGKNNTKAREAVGHDLR